MKLQDPLNTHTPPEPDGQRKGGTWLAYLGAVLIVALIVGVSIFVFSQGKAHHGQGPILQPSGPGTTPPPSGQWVQSLNGYTVTSLEAVRSDPAVLYACAVQGQLKTGNNVPYTIMRSSDFGSHWQDVGSKATLMGSCQLAVNPANSNEIYVVSGPRGASSAGPISYILQHSTDGGKTWTAILPTLHITDIKPALPWSVQQISLEGNTLFGIQWVAAEAPFPHPEIMPDGSFPLGRLVESVDGGHTWVEVDSHFNATGQGVRSYAVDPSDTRTIYEIVGTLWWPVAQAHPQENVVPGIYGINQALYKTTNGGASWTLLLNDVSFGSKVQLASSSPNIVYVGGTQIPFPMEGQAGYQTEQPSYRIAYRNFLLRVSSDGGMHWREAAKESQLTSILNWFVSPDGQVYTLSTTSASGAKVMGYNPSTDTWSTITSTPTSGALLAVTPTGTANKAVLWLVSTSNQAPTLYRYVA